MALVTAHSPEEWAGLCSLTESKRPHEWPFVQWVIRNRAESKLYDPTVAEVVLASRQFSAFNDTYGDPDDKYEQALADAGPGAAKALELAVGCARWVLGSPRSGAPFGPGVLWFYSPQSMKPAYQAPSWSKNMRIVPVIGVHPARFIFLEETGK